MYFDWLDDAEKIGWKLTEGRSEVIQLFKEAGVEDALRPHVEPVGYGQIQTAQVSVMDNFPNSRKDFVQITVSKFHQAIGTFKSRMWEALNPLYWIESVIMLPKTALTYVGVKPEHFSVKILQLIYWLTVFILTALYNFFGPGAVSFIQKIIHKP